MTSFLINESLLVDAGSAASTLPASEQARISGILLTHVHLDHVGEIPFIADNIFGIREAALPVISLKSVLEDLHKYLFNNVIWPDFTTVLSGGDHPILEFVSINEDEIHSVDGIRFTAHSVNHNVNAVGYIFSDDEGSVIFTGDTGPTKSIWKKGHALTDLRAIITEVSFPNRLQSVADTAKHFTPASVRQELMKMPPGVPVYLFHEKSRFHDEILAEIENLREPRLRMLIQGQTYEF